MKKLKLLLPALLLCSTLFGQAGQINQINIVNFTVKNTLPGTVDSWISTPAALVLVAQKVPGSRVLETKLVLQIRAGSAVICGNNFATAKTIDPFDVRTFNTADIVSMLGNCHELKEGTYTLCAQFYNIDKVAISREVCKDFRVEPANVEYAPPTLITPENEKKFNWTQLEGPVTFRWTPLVPKPKEPVTYRLRVWQLMQGQTGTQAIRTNTPLIQKDVENLTQTTVNSVLTGPCKPPYLCDFIWNVQALNRAGKPMGNNNGTSEPYTFGATADTKCPTHSAPEDKKRIPSAEASKSITFKWTKTPGAADNSMYRLKVWQLMQGQNGTQAMKTNSPVVTRELRNVTEVTVNSIYTGPCKPPYLCDFIWAVEMMDASGKIACTSEPTTFSVTDETVKCAINTFPEDKKKFTIKEAKDAITFKWKKSSTSGETPNYRIKVWQLMEGQNGTQAMRTNAPVVTKEVRNVTEVTVNNLYTGPCKPPYLCDFIWAIEMTDATGKVTCTSDPTTFKIANNDIDIQIDSLDVTCCKDGKQNIYLKLKNNLATPVKITQIKIDKVNGVTANIIPSPLTPGLTLTIPGNGTQIFTGQINCIDTAKIIRIWVAAEDPFDNAITETEVEADTLHCRCDACDEKNFVLNAPAPGQISTTANAITFNQSITVTTTPPKTIKSIKAELVYFEMIPENDQCIPCDKDATLYGHFANGNNNQTWTGPQTSLSIAINTPITPCCSTTFRWCIRYKIEFKDCTVCSKVVCYEKKKAGCTPSTGGGENPDKNNPK